MAERFLEDGSEKCTTSPDNDYKSVFLIGDSIRMGYCGKVKKLLEGKANVFYPEDNCCNTQYILALMAFWENICDFSKVDLVCFNAGHWDVAHFDSDPEPLTTLDEYAKNIGRIINRIRFRFPNAKVCFVTTTPMNPNGKQGINPRNTSEIIKYNAAAQKVAKEKGVSVVDAFALMKDKGEEFFIDYCHLIDEGYDIIAKEMVTLIEKELNI